MKPTIILFTILFCSCIAVAATAQCIRATVCFKDGTGFRYQFDNPELVGINTYMANGTCSGYPGGSATIWLDLTKGIDNGKVKLIARSVADNNCRKTTDSFMYTGTVQIVKEGNNMHSYTGSGNWISYCHGEQFGQGKWSAKGPCNALNDNLQKQSGITPVDGSEATAHYEKGIIAAPNPVSATTTITYIVRNAGKTNVTVYNSVNQPVKVLVNEIKMQGTYTLQWNLENANGAKVPTGVYRVVLTTATGKWYNNVQVLRN